MAEVVDKFKGFTLSLQMIVGGAVAFLIGSFLDLYSGAGVNLLDWTTGILGLASMIAGAVLFYLQKSKLWALVAILIPTGAVLFLFLRGILDDGGTAGIGLWLLTLGGLAASWGAIQQVEGK